MSGVDVFSFGVSTWRKAILNHIRAPWLDRLRKAAASLVGRIDRTSPQTRLATAAIVSIALHLVLLWLMLMTPAKGLLSIGTTGEGHLNGAGTAIDLVQAIDMPSAHSDSLSTSDVVAIKQFAETEARPEDTKTADKIALNGLTSQALTDALAAEAGKDSTKLAAAATPDSAGAHGQNGTEKDALWNAIAPCWYRLTNADTLPATLKVNFSPTGGLAVPPEIERDPAAPITSQVLQSEAKAIAALAECGAYPMAQGQQDVRIYFPAP